MPCPSICCPPRALLIVTAFVLSGGLASAQAKLGDDKVLSTELRVTTHLDWRGTTDPDSAVRTFSVRRARVGIRGTALDRVEYQVERSLTNSEAPWRDVFVNIALWSPIEVTAGRFKIPFSREQLTSVAELDFVSRSLAATYLAPGRDVGIMAHGRLVGRRVRYQVGGFRTGGDNVRDTERHNPQHGGVLAGRVVLKPWTGSKSARFLRDLSLGAAVTRGQVPEGEYSIRGETIAEVAFFPSVAVRGARRRVGAEIDWRAGPVALSSEVIHVVDERLGQGIDDERLPDVVAKGWYIGGAWRVIGQKKTSGALELAARLEDLRIGSNGSGVWVPGNPRTEALATQSDQVWTAGVNWYVNRFIKIQGNIARESRQDAGVRGRRIWNPMMRFQFSL